MTVDTGKSTGPRPMSSALAGSMSGTVVSALVQPFDVVRTRMHVDSIGGTLRSTPEAFRLVTAESGLRGLWRGTSATMIRLGLGAGTHFFFLELVKPAFSGLRPDGSRALGPAGAALAGGSARAMATVLLSPFTLIKTRLEATGALGVKGRKASMYSVARDVVQKSGVRGLWRGCLPAVLSNAPFSAIYYSVYSDMRARLAGAAWPPTVANLSAGLLAAMSATLLTQPGDVVRSRIQLGVSKGVLRTLAATMKSGGSAAVLAGMTPRFLKRSLQTALIWTIYEELLPLVSSQTAKHTR